MAKLLADLSLEPKDALEFFQRKGEAFAFDYTDLMGEKNVQSFTVAKATTSDILGMFRKEVERGIRGEITFQDFKKTLRPRLQELGWWGKQELLDGETGEITKVQLGSDRRLRTIFQTNVRVAHSAGRYKQYLANAVNRPYWRYSALMDGRTRPAHAALHGKVWRFDDPIWAIIWPPNGWGCRCDVEALTEAEFMALGVPLEQGKDAVVEFDMPVNKAGETVKVKGVKYIDERGNEKIFRPDPGWDYNPGEAWSRFDPAAFKGEDIGLQPVTAQPSKVIKSLDGLKTWADFERPDLRAPEVPRLPEPQLLPMAETREEAQRQINDALFAPGEVQRVVKTPLDEVVIRAEMLPDVVAKAADAPERYANHIIPALESPFEIWLTPYADGTYRKRYIALFKGKSDLLVIVRQNRDGSLYWEVYDELNANSKRLNKLREGTLIYVREGDK